MNLAYLIQSAYDANLEIAREKLALLTWGNASAFDAENRRHGMGECLEGLARLRASAGVCGRNDGSDLSYPPCH